MQIVSTLPPTAALLLCAVVCHMLESHTVAEVNQAYDSAGLTRLQMSLASYLTLQCVKQTTKLKDVLCKVSKEQKKGSTF